MKKIAFITLAFSFLFLNYSCHKPEKVTEATTVSENEVIADFVSIYALPQYRTLRERAGVLNGAVAAFNTTPTEANLSTAKTAWLSLRETWEQCEGFLFGPIEDNDFDPNMDTWPVDYRQLDSLLGSSYALTPAGVAVLDNSLKGFHPLEYMLWGVDGHRTATSLTARQRTYMVSLGENLAMLTASLESSWVSTGGNYQAQLLEAGTGSTTYTRFPKKQDVFITITTGIIGICEEVGEGKMKEPFDNMDSLLSESPYAHNSITDFTNNIKGAQNAYLCSFAGTQGRSLSSYVAGRNAALDAKIKDRFGVALQAMSNITTSFESGIFTQRTQIQNAMNAIADLKTVLENELKPFILQNVKN